MSIKIYRAIFADSDPMSVAFISLLFGMRAQFIII